MSLRFFIILWFFTSSLLKAQNDDAYSNDIGGDYIYSNYYQQGWHFYGNSSINTSQSSFSNWQGGGLNSISLSTAISLNLVYQGQKAKWENSLDAGYGIMLQGNENKWFKNDDRLAFNTKLGVRANERWYYTTSLEFYSQFQPGFWGINDTLPISDFMAPGYVTVALGFDYNPSSKLSLVIGPLASKNTIVLNQDLANQGAYGVEPGEYDYLTGKYLTLGKKVRSETGASIRLEYNEYRILKNIGVQSRLALFANYLENFGNIDVNFETTFNMKINENISTVLMLHFIYDDDIQIALDELGERTGPRLQFKEVLGVGLNINIGETGY